LTAKPAHICYGDRGAAVTARRGAR